jgi:metal-responsive CopG/Arc/MetJ family transcriptional regulator
MGHGGDAQITVSIKVNLMDSLHRMIWTMDVTHRSQYLSKLV